MKKNFPILALITAISLSLLVYGFTNNGNDKDVVTNSAPSNILYQSDINQIQGYNYDDPLVALYTHNELVNAPGQGQGGADVSFITAPGTLYGFGCQANLYNWMGDAFTVPAGQNWHIDSIKFYSYQTGSPLTSTITGSHVAIWNGRVDSAGVTLNSGDTTANRLLATYWSNIYRTTATPPYNTQTTRPIMAVVDTLSTTLSAGYYWVQFSFRGSLGSGPWAPPRTILNNPITGNGKQKLAGVWGNAMDGTNPQGLPFVIYGTNLVAISNNNTGVPVNYSLKQNYPNPFNPTTKVSFDLSKAGMTKIAVYDVMGREVDVVVNKNMEAGSYSFDYNASKLSSGLYFYTLTSGDYKETKKMMLVK
ncbi:MAG: T9SS type A sorting domain-containing protein [Ignavibacteria bacterium]|nr:T9SS type A sorting domain-containing protein [Ignavibacteria bacterium]